MLSYQHAYHAGNRADLQKHVLLASVLDALTRRERPITYMETHAGRGVYDLDSVEAQKTGEAEEGWLALKPAEIKKLPQGFVETVKALNKGELLPLYPGSPMVAAHMLRPGDVLRLMELHPQEYEALAGVFKNDNRVQVQKRDGVEGIFSLSVSPERQAVVLIDPSYEIKSEYETIPDFTAKLAAKWPQACILVWAPMLPAGRHGSMVEKLEKEFPQVRIFKDEWGGDRMFGSVMVGINLPEGI